MPSLVQGRFIREILQGTNIGSTMEEDTDIDIREVYFLIMHFLSSGPCHRTFGQLWNELLEHKLLPRRYHAWYSRKGLLSGDEDDDGLSYPLNYTQLVNRYPHIGKNHLVKLLKQLLLKTSASANSYGLTGANVPTLLGSGLFSLLESEQTSNSQQLNQKVNYLCWPHSQGNQVHALSLREIGGGFTKHHRAPSIRAASYAIAKPSSLLQKIERIKTLRGHLSAVYCAIFDRSGQYFISGSDDRLVKIWSMETGFCLSSCRGHTGDITDLAVSINNVLVASASNDCIIRVWRLPDGFPISVLRGHTLAVTAIAFSPRPGCEHHLLSSSDDGSCRIWDSRDHHVNPRIYIPKPDDGARLTVSRSNDHPQSSNHQGYKILCCAFNASGTSFVTGSSDNLARVWSVMKRPDEVANQHHHELDVLTGHENDVNYVQFSCTAVPGRLFSAATIKEESVPNLKNGWLTHDNIVTCSRDGSAIIWIPRSRKSHGRTIRWTRAYHLKVPPPPVPPQQPRGGPRQRTVPTPRGVNMIVWSLDNHFVLAAITDNRICVWNAVDGSLVHCLTGHTESTYVLDVHPFDPRIAMSAGYDGKTIVWDIWQGVPIRIYEVGKFKLVDGKFSPDGTSIVLSDDFGQIYILGTGDGRSQKDAKYDQFFLGDYLNLTHDINGNVVDQETMLTPYARNQQDLLCDVGRIPYPEPYQSMYQQRRSLALGIDWKPSSINLGVGAGDTSFYAMPDDNSNRGRFLDYPVELPDGLDLELENENPSDDTGSEYYATDESSSEGLPPSLNEESLGESENSAEELYSSNDDGYYVSNIPRSRKMRRKETIHVSSGRRLKRKASDENGSGFTIKKSKYSRHGKSTLDNKKSSGKVSRPQRRAARNARQLFSAIEEAFEGESDSEGSGSSADEENILSEECETPESSGVQLGSSDNEEIYEQHSLHLQPSSSSRKYHVMRNEESHSPTPTFPIQHEESKEVKVTEPTKRTGIVWKFRCNETRPVNLIQQATSDRALERQEGSIFGVSLKGKQQVGSHNYDKIHITQPGNALEPKDMKDRSEVPCQSGIEETNESSKETENVLSSHQDGLLGRPGKAIEWGEAKARRSKRPRMNESIVIANSLKPNTDKLYFLSKQMLPSRVGRGSYDQSSELFNKNCSQEHINQTQKSYVAACGTFLSQLNDKDNPTDSEAMLPKTQSQKVASPSQFNIDVCQVEDDHRQDAVHVSNGNANGFRNLLENGHSLAVTGVNQNRFGKFMRRSKRGNQDRNAIIHMENQYLQTNNINLKHEMGWANNWPRNAVHMGNSCEASGSRGLHDEPNSKFIGEDNEREGYEDGQQFESSVNHAKECSADLGGSSSGGPNRITRIKFTCNKVPMIGPQRMRSKRAIHARKSDIEAGDCFKNQSILERRKGKEEVERHNKVQLRNKEPIYGLEWGSTSTRLCGIRDHSTKKDSAITNSRMLSERKIGKQIAKKQSWLMLYEAEEGLRYIPQLGDTVAYIKQGHEEFLQASPFQERAPWKIIKGNIRCVELCCVEGLDYATVPGSGETCCKLTLRFTDPESDVFGKTFRLNLPEVTHTADFLVERSRYDSSLNRNWTIRDKCRVWWTNDKGEEGSWYDGRIIAVKPKSDEFPDSPWDRYHVQYKADTDGPQKHSPWELFDLDDYSFEQPQIDHNTRETLLQVLEDIEKPSNSKADRYGLGKFSQALEKPEFLNRIPLPMALDIIMRRLENSYYRQLDAFKHDIGTMVANAKAYFTKDTKTIAKLQRFEKKVFAKLES